MLSHDYLRQLGVRRGKSPESRTQQARVGGGVGGGGFRGGGKAWINSAGRILSRISDFRGEQSARRIRHLQAEFEQYDGKSEIPDP